MKICYFFLKSKKDLGGRKILFTLWAFSKSQRVKEYKGQTQIFSNKVAAKSNTTVVKNFYLQIHEYYWLVFGLLEIKQNLACTSAVSSGNHSISKVSSSQVGVVLSRLLFRVSNNAIKT